MRISVIVCTYNRARFLRLCGESWTALKRLAGAEAEFLIVDNNSDDDTAAASRALVTAIKAKPGWTASYHFEPVQGLSAARNRGVAEAAGDWVAFLDDECLTPADWLLRLEEEIRAQAPDAIGGPYRGRFTPDGAYPPSFLERYGDSHHLRDGWEARWLSKPGLSGGNIAVRRALLREAGGFDPALGMNGAVIAFGEESELQTRLLARGAKLYFSPRLELVHFIRPEKSDLNAGLTAARRRA
ncbi:MAG: glycosyltransferase, partial [Pseudomonadota bacterium]